MRPFPGRLLAASALVAALVAIAGSTASAGSSRGTAAKPRVVLVAEIGSCKEVFARLVCQGFRRALARVGVEGRLIAPTSREDIADVLSLLADQRHDLVISFGFGYYDALGEAARRRPDARFASLDAPHNVIAGQPANVLGVVFRTSEAAFLAGWLAGRLEAARRGRDTVGVVAGVKIPSVDDFVIGFRAGARRASRGLRVLVSYSRDFGDTSKCKAIARRQIARGAGVLLNVAGGCGLGTLEAAKEAGVWGVGVDTDQAFLGPHVLTSVLKRYEGALVTVLRRLKSRRLPTGRDLVLTLEHGAVGLGRISGSVPRRLRAELDRLSLRIARGQVRVPGAYRDPR